MICVFNFYPKQNWIVDAFRKYDKEIVQPGKVQHKKITIWKSAASKDPNMIYMKHRRLPWERASRKEYNSRKLLGRQDATWNKCDMEECNIKSAQREEKQQQKKGTMKGVKQKTGQKWRSKPKRVQHEKSATGDDIHKKKVTTWNKCNPKKGGTWKEYTKGTTSKQYHMKKVWHEKSAPRKKFMMKTLWREK